MKKKRRWDITTESTITKEKSRVLIRGIGMTTPSAVCVHLSLSTASPPSLPPSPAYLFKNGFKLLHMYCVGVGKVEGKARCERTHHANSKAGNATRCRKYVHRPHSKPPAASSRTTCGVCAGAQSLGTWHTIARWRNAIRRTLAVRLHPLPILTPFRSPSYVLLPSPLPRHVETPRSQTTRVGVKAGEASS